MKKVLACILTMALILAAFAGCAEGAAVKRRIIIDTDTAADDAAAMLLAALSPDIEIVGVTVAAGNVDIDQAVKNALMTLELAGCDAPVYAGAVSTYSGEVQETFSVFGKDGMSDAGLIHPTASAAEGDATDFIVDTVRADPGEIEIVALGPVTNIALALDRDPEVMKGVKRIWSMGTAGLGPGNATPVAEFNVYKDAEAYKRLLDAKLPMTVIGLDMDAENCWFYRDDLERMTEIGGFDRYIATASRALAAYKGETEGNYYADLPDAVAMSCVVWPDFIRSSVLCSASCIADETEAYGLVIFYRTDRAYDSMIRIVDPNVTLVTGIDDEGFKERFIEALSG